MEIAVNLTESEVKEALREYAERKVKLPPVEDQAHYRWEPKVDITQSAERQQSNYTTASVRFTLVRRPEDVRG